MFGFGLLVDKNKTSEGVTLNTGRVICKLIDNKTVCAATKLNYASVI